MAHLDEAGWPGVLEVSKRQLNLAIKTKVQLSTELAQTQRHLALLVAELVSTYLNLATTLTSLGGFQEAELALQRLLEIEPKHPEGLKSLGQLYWERQRYGDAIQTFLTVLRQNPRDEAVLLVLADCYGIIGDWEIARKLCQQLLQINPAHAEAARRLDQIARILQSAPGKADAVDEPVAFEKDLLQQADASARRGAWGEAITCLQHILSIAPNSPEIYQRLGQAYLQEGDLTKAQSMWARETALALAPVIPSDSSDLNSLLLLAQCYQVAGQLMEAEPVIYRVLALDPRQTTARDMLSRLAMAKLAGAQPAVSPNSVRRSGPHGKDRPRVLYLDSNGVGLEAIRVDTIAVGILGLADGGSLPPVVARVPQLAALANGRGDRYAPLAYIADWREAFCTAPELDVDVCNINNLVHYTRCLRELGDYDLIVVSHAAAGDSMFLVERSAADLLRRRAPLAMFVGNEYDLLEEKIHFARQVKADFICSQLPLEAAQYLYCECADTRILPMPHALNPAVYYPAEGASRETDIGFIGDIYFPFMGDIERTSIIHFFERFGTSCGLRCDIRKQRVPPAEWARFLNGCQGIVGAEAGTYYLNDRGRALSAAKAYYQAHPQATHAEIFRRFYQDLPKGVSGKAVSSRHFEPIGTKTAQILVEGHFNGILRADEHYISVKKDLSNIDEAVRRFRDEAYRREMVERTYDYVMAEHTHRHRIRALTKAVFG